MTYAPDTTAPHAGPDATDEPSASRRGLGCLLEIVETLVLTLVIYLLIHNFIAQPFEVEQESMVPTIVENEYVLIDKITPRFDEYQRGDIVVFQPPPGFEQNGVPFIKRIIGLPGDTVTLDNGRVYVTPSGGTRVQLVEPYVVRDIDGGVEPTLPKDAESTTEWVVPAGQFFVMGDNRPQSQDSRFFGPIDRELIVGRAWLRYFPLDRIGFMNRPEYEGLPSGTDAEAVTRPPQLLAGSSATIQVSMARP
ncbi:MAG TPA: signal peptidase I [Candidatus Limnocylindria bacterium]|jgi:signal peptidase I